MGIEIERKFLVSGQIWREQASKPVSITQGYLCDDQSRSVRVRTEDDKGYLVVKGGVQDECTRPEFDYEIPFEDAFEMLHKMVAFDKKVHKMRYTIEHKTKTWYIDEFTGANSGLVIAEIELQSEDERFDLPMWVDCEVTHDDRYYNVYLADRPFSMWE